MDKRIIVIGAGQGGLSAAEALAKAGASVTVYEKNTEDTAGIDWFDGISKKLFSDLDIKVPEDSFKGFAPSFIAPFSDKPLLLSQKSEDMDWSVNRKTFTKQLIASARESGVEFVFDTEVEKLVFSSHSVCGVTVGGEDVPADLVIDASGMNSPFRASLPVRAGIPAAPDEDDVFNVYRGIYSRTPGYPELPDNRKFSMYLKYQGKKSISWCGVEPSGELNVLVGIMGKMTRGDFHTLYSQLKIDNPIIGEVIGNRSAQCAIPVRYPATKLFYPGYALVGDSAFMTIPIMGSGIENALRAGRMLAKAIIENDSVDESTLWKYQVNYFRGPGAVCFFFDWIKRGLLETDNNELKKFLESGAVTDDDIKAIMLGSVTDIPLTQWIKKPAKFISSHKMINGILVYALRGLKAAAVAYSIPGEYDTLKTEKWIYKAERSMKKD